MSGSEPEWFKRFYPHSPMAAAVAWRVARAIQSKLGLSAPTASRSGDTVFLSYADGKRWLSVEATAAGFAIINAQDDKRAYWGAQDWEPGTEELSDEVTWVFA